MDPRRPPFVSYPSIPAALRALPGLHVWGPSAWQLYEGQAWPRRVTLLFRGDWGALARSLPEARHEPGLWGSALWPGPDARVYEIRLEDDEPSSTAPSLSRNPGAWQPAAWDFDLDRGVFSDPEGLAGRRRDPAWRQGPLQARPPGPGPGSAPAVLSAWETLWEASLWISQGWGAPEGLSPAGRAHSPDPVPLDPRLQGLWLAQILDGPGAAEALLWLHRQGLVAAWWPELAALEPVTQDKEFHPEGGAFDHSLEVLRHRKDRHPVLDLALLLHDLGKAVTGPVGRNRFHGHAEEGAGLARNFLRRLGFGSERVDDVTWLVRHHMLPGLLERIDLDSAGVILKDPRFPWLLELFRCDTAARWKEPEAYHRACAVYKRWQAAEERQGRARGRPLRVASVPEGR